MNYFLDTNICIYLMNGRNHISILQKIEECEPGSVAISSIVLAELEYGMAGSKRPKEAREQLLMFLLPMAIVSFDYDAAEQYGKIRRYSQENGTMIGALDMLIAAHALALDITLVTNNEKEFSRVPGLRVENWTN